MKKLTLNLPETLEINDAEVLMILAAKLYEQGRLSLGQAADLGGLSKVEFAESLANYQVSIFNYPASEISRDVRNA